MVLSTIDEIAIEVDKKSYNEPTTADVKSESIQYVEEPTLLEWTEAEEQAVKRKIDWHTVPLVTTLYLLCFLDRANIGNARIQGMAKDIDLKGYRFNWALSTFYIIYLLVEIPSNIILKRIGPRFYLPFLVAGFGLVSMCTAFVRSYEGLVVARAFLGIFEGGAMPGFSFFLSNFYKREELLFRLGIFISSAALAGAFGGLLATGLSRIPEWGFDGAPIHTWRNIFFFEGFITLLFGGFAPLWMPSNPATAYFLDERQRSIAVERLQRQHKADAEQKVTASDVKRALLCIHNYTCGFGFFLINITVQGISVFMPTILADLGWTATRAQLYSVPPYVVAAVTAITIAWFSDRTRQRGIYLAAFSMIAVIGFAILRFETEANIRYLGVFFVTAGAFPGGPGFYSAGPSVRAVTSAYVVSIGTIGGIVATLFGIVWYGQIHTACDLIKWYQTPISITMRLLNTRTKELRMFNHSRIPYAILSHTWGPEEITLQDLLAGNAHILKGYKKLMGACRQALSDGFDYIWIDTCCIDKTSSSELTEAINSMWAWYRNSRVCYAYLEDVAQKDIEIHGGYSSGFMKSRWFTRGWTLQELIAPSMVIFYSENWHEIGTRDQMRESLGEITGIDYKFFEYGILGRYSIAQRMSWAAKRKTTRVEDQAYCLLGLFGVSMPLLYGEGEMAFIRLQEEIMRRTDDQSIFAWLQPGPSRNTGFLAKSPSYFNQSGGVKRVDTTHRVAPYSFTNKGIQIEMPLLEPSSSKLGFSFIPGDNNEQFGSAAGISFTFSPTSTIAILNCNRAGRHLGLYLERAGDLEPFYRCSHKLGFVSVPEDWVKAAKIETILLRAEDPEDMESLWGKDSDAQHIVVELPQERNLGYDTIKAFPVGRWANSGPWSHSIMLSYDVETSGKEEIPYLHIQNAGAQNGFCMFFKFKAPGPHTACLLMDVAAGETPAVPQSSSFIVASLPAGNRLEALGKDLRVTAEMAASRFAKVWKITMENSQGNTDTIQA
ncbi:major facilitator superfamily transporter [Colletotrichum orchidophilum]|uniref:Major facilitator superfamily transporter n=1 Tax=Colletotrichum orchidophilum TaxID=1209926 RepID=A0A1G4BEQ6_9PEZI|nr:major facilitator superfamily transporter [Colletotrichum orchidophilum]OHE99924.1 major facilitator superfamily transporter [Colletotrichum orchidophilum]